MKDDVRRVVEKVPAPSRYAWADVGENLQAVHHYPDPDGQRSQRCENEHTGEQIAQGTVPVDGGSSLASFGVDRSSPSRPFAMVGKGVLQPHISVRSDVSTRSRGATANVDGPDGCVGRERAANHALLVTTAATVTVLEINDSARSPERPSGALGRQFLRPTGSATPSERSTGLRTQSGPRLRTCVYTIVVLTSEWPRSSCTVPMSSPSSSRCVANACRNVCGPTRSVMPPWRAPGRQPSGQRTRGGENETVLPIGDPCRRERPEEEMPPPLSRRIRVLAVERER